MDCSVHGKMNTGLHCGHHIHPLTKSGGKKYWWHILAACKSFEGRQMLATNHCGGNMCPLEDVEIEAGFRNLMINMELNAHAFAQIVFVSLVGQ